MYRTLATVTLACSLGACAAVSERFGGGTDDVVEVGANVPASPHQLNVLDDVTGAFGVIDADADGYVTETEAAGYQDVEERWDALDVDGDGRLDSEEFAALAE